ncbi:YetF domain-containing protein [Desulfosporosinus sp. SB140]|uniref:YetF domain-containing protein n=1 Tax=Desulfosporosinus paludis TaxID=3115649 RepID=UPI0038907220
MNNILRILLSFFMLWLGLRVLGKKQIGELSIYNVATIAAVGEMASSLATDLHDSPFNFIFPLLGYFLLTYLMTFFSLKSRFARKVFEGSPTIVISNGKILEQNLKSLRLSIENLFIKLREEKVFNLKEIEFAIMEPDGKLSILLKPLYRTITAENLHLTTQYEGLPTILVREGRFEEESLKRLGITKSWIMTQLHAQNVSEISEVFLAQLDTSGQLYIDLITDW